MKKLCLNKGWTVRPLSREGAARRVDLPHDAMLDEPRVLASAGGDHIGWYIGGDYEYTRTLDVPTDWAGKLVILEFEGVYRGAEVSINGEKAGFRPSGYADFHVDISSFLRYGGENQIRVIARNSDQPNSRWYTGTGIYRPVNLWLGGAAHIRLNGVKVRPVDHETGTVEVLVRLSRPGKVSVAIMDGNRVAVERTHESVKRSVLFRMNVPSPKLWDTEYPFLYTCRVTFSDDVVEVPFGLRTLSWDADDGLMMNGQPLTLRGACVHHDNGPLGACAHPEAEARKVRLLKEAGFNALRSAHNPCSGALLDACDRMGMLVLDEYADAWVQSKTPYDYARVLEDWWQDDLFDLVEKDCNHPSVVMYSIGNEVCETARVKGLRLAEEMVRTLHKLDDSRPVTCALNGFFNLMNARGMLYGKKGRRAAIPANIGGRVMRLGAMLPGSDTYTHDVYEFLDVAGYNYGELRYRRDLNRYPDRLMLGTESLPGDAWRTWRRIADEPQILGDFVWCGMDYIGQTGMTTPEYGCYRIEGEETRMTGGFGLLDITGKPRFEAACWRVAAGLEPGPVLGVLPVGWEEPPEPNPWLGTPAIQSWAWPDGAGKTAEVEVCSRGREVELRLNGAIVARKPLGRRGRVRFRLPYAPGKLTAVAYDRDGSVVGTCALASAREDTELRLIPEEEDVRPGELCFVRARFTDSAGVWKPTERHTLTAQAQNGQVVVLASGCAYLAGNYNAEVTDTYYGEALIVLRAGEGQTVTLSVRADNGLTAQAEIPVVAE